MVGLDLDMDMVVSAVDSDMVVAVDTDMDELRLSCV
jgi:hypothetical protein